jgi:RNA polymerase sigma-70 factor (ECF subfamily)
VVPQDSFEGLMSRLQAGDQDAASELFDRFARSLTSLARQRLDHRLREKVDPEDVVQSVYRTFFRRFADGRFSLDGWDGLWALLTTITVRKCGRWRERFTAAGRDVGAEVSLGALAGGVPLECLAREPSPVEAATLADLLESLLGALEAGDRAIIALRLQGYTPGEIALQLGRPERTVFRVISRVKGRLQRLCTSD